VKTFEVARETYRSIDNLAVGDLASAASYAETSAWLMEGLEEQGRTAEAAKIGEEAIGIASRVLEKSPAHMGAMRSRALLSSGLSQIYYYDLRPRRAVAQTRVTARDWEVLIRNDPGNSIAWNNLFVTQLVQASALRGMGDTEGGIAVLKASLDLEKRAPAAVRVIGNSGFHTALRALWEADLGRGAEARATLALSNAKLEQWMAQSGRATFQGREAVASAPFYTAVILWADGDFARARDEARKAVSQLQAVATSGEGQLRIRNGDLADANGILAEALLALKDLAPAESAAREAVRIRLEGTRRARRNKQELAQDQTLLAIILAREGKLAEARAVNEPALAFHRELLQRGSEDVNQHLVLASSLYAAALASPSQAPGLLPEAKRILDGLPQQAQKTKTVSRVRDWIVTAMAQKP
jgi:hypothetical protein